MCRATLLTDFLFSVRAAQGVYIHNPLPCVAQQHCANADAAQLSTDKALILLGFYWAERISSAASCFGGSVSYFMPGTLQRFVAVPVILVAYFICGTNRIDGVCTEHKKNVHGCFCPRPYTLFLIGINFHCQTRQNHSEKVTTSLGAGVLVPLM